MLQRLTLATFLLAAAQAASAQSTVSVFGVIDAYVGEAKSGSTSIKRMEDGGSAPSRLGFRGSEDLGDGLDAHFWLEGGFNPDTGAGNLPAPGALSGFQFTRQSYVGVSGRWGSLDMGRMYTPMFYTVFRGDPFGLNTVFSPLNLEGANDAQPGLANFAARGNNMIRYRTPSSLPWFADIAVAAGEGTAARLIGFTGGWLSGPLYLGYGFQSQQLSGVKSTYQAISGAYDFNVVKLYASALRNTGSLSTTPAATLLALGATVPFGVQQLLVEGTRRKVTDSARSQTAWTFGYDYNLSKRTQLYARYLTLANDGGSGVSLAQVPVVANSGNSARLIAAGIRHSF